MDTKNRLNDEIKRLQDLMSTLDPLSQEYAIVEDNLNKLMNQQLEIEKHETSAAQTEKQMKADKVDRVVRYFIETGKVVLPLVVTVGGSLLAWRIEASGIVPFGFGKKYVDKLTKY